MNFEKMLSEDFFNSVIELEEHGDVYLLEDILMGFMGLWCSG